MSLWITVRSYLLGLLVEFAIPALASIFKKLKPELLQKAYDFIQATYDAAVANGDIVTQSIMSLLADILGYVIVVPVAPPAPLSPADILSVKEEMLKSAVNNYIVEKEPKVPYWDEMKGDIVYPE